MKINVQNKKHQLPPKGNYDAELVSVTAQSEESKPEQIAFGFKIPGFAEAFEKKCPIDLDEGTPLRQVIETLRGQPLTSVELEEGYEPQLLVGTKCAVQIAHELVIVEKTVAVVNGINAAKKAEVVA